MFAFRFARKRDPNQAKTVTLYLARLGFSLGRKLLKLFYVLKTPVGIFRWPKLAGNTFKYKLLIDGPMRTIQMSKYL